MLSSNLIPLSQQSTITTIWPKLGMNYGNDLLGGASYNASQITMDLTFLKNLGISALRLAMPFYTDAANITNFQNVLAIAKKLGFYCIWGVNHGVTITNGNWATIKTAQLSQANASAGWTYPPDEWMIDNEATLGHDGTIASTTIRADLKTMATTVKGYASWKVSFGESELDFEGNDNIITWASVGIGSFDYASFHIYDTFANFKTKVNNVISNFGSIGYLSEWGPPSDFVSGGWTESGWAAEYKQRINFLKSVAIGRQAHIYTFRSPDNWEVCLSTYTFRQAWQAILAGV